MEPKNEKFNSNEKKLEIVIAVFLSVAALCTAWSTWVSGLHGSNMNSNYAESDNLQTEGNSLWNEANEYVLQDMILWNDVSALQIAYQLYEDGDEKTLTANQLYYLCYENLTDEMAEAIGWDFDRADAVEDPADYIDEWLENEKSQITPFSDDEYVSSYYAEAQEEIDEAAYLLEEGNEDNLNADKYALCPVFFSVVMFLLGIAGIFKNIPNRVIVVTVGIIILIIGIVYMISIPLPRGFSLANYF